tara:strand:- start:354 stop:515 length:162 start_codon:yes stop_codon:yes gene_type:complete
MPAKKTQASLAKTKNTTTYRQGGSTSKMKMYKRGGESGTPKSLPGGCGGRRKK